MLMGTLVLKMARRREKSSLPQAPKRFERRAPEVMMLIREAFLRGLSTRQVGWVLGMVSETVSAQTVSRLTRSLDRLVKKLREASLKDEWAYLLLDGVSLRVRRPAVKNACRCWWRMGVRRGGSRQLL